MPSSPLVFGDRVPIHAIVLDYGEVLCHPADPADMTRMAGEAGIDPDRFAALYWQLREDYDRGTLDGPRYWARLGTAAGVPMPDERVARLIARDIDTWTRLDAVMLSWTETLFERRMAVGLLSNMVCEIGSYLRHETSLLRRFAHVTYSFEVGSVKPEPEIYRHVLQGLDVSADRALLIDDRPPNIDGARAIGMHGLLFRGYDALMADLSAFELVSRPSP
jgi:putative hydrolase of the HAD superfamily